MKILNIEYYVFLIDEKVRASRCDSPLSIQINYCERNNIQVLIMYDKNLFK